ncbi:heparinase II/III family protein [Niabella sp.]|uniref:heparinase II/III domain-containing protein n=1 Tax=Niabella sp. TaxID=1962976 RepID=UPI002604C711|nr:heparinase II/III family protein [Niabella sp.]
MKKLFYFILTVLFLLSGNTKSASAPLTHPYLIMNMETQREIKKAISSNKTWQDYHNRMIEGADSILLAPVLNRTVDGRRMLEVSRECLRRILLLGYAYRMTGKESYAQRAESEMKQVSKFADWNPSHFLDAAEMTTAMAIGYDWFFNYISDATKKSVAKAIEMKGLRPSFNKIYNDHWLDNHNNWNQVCHTGMTLGALAIYDRIPRLAATIVSRAVEKVKLAMEMYAPDGAYPEGYSYWAYGTTYNILLIEALKAVRGTDYGLSQMPGFMKTGNFIQNMILGDGKSFNYGDCNNSGRMYPPMFWFAKQTKNTDILWGEKYFLSNASKSNIIDYRYGLYAIIWGSQIKTDDIHAPREQMWVSATSQQPVAIMRTDWQFKQGLSAAIKAGTAQAGHTHLDVGSFIITDHDVRWAMDFGPQDYNSIEQLGMDLWGRNQESDRWKLFRYNNQAHNTLTFNNQLQDVESYSAITETGNKRHFMYATLDMSTAYKNQVASAKRGMALVDEQYFVIRDEIKTLNKPTVVRWNMLTQATPKMLDAHTMELSLQGKKLLIQVASSAKISLKTWSTVSPNSYDEANPNTLFVGFEAQLTPGAEETFQVKLIPGEHPLNVREIQQLKNWKNY